MKEKASSKNLVQLLSLMVAFSGVLVIFGWIFDVTILKSISPAWVSMKFDAAIAFCLSGIMLYSLARVKRGEFDMAQIVISTASFVVILLMGTLLISSLLGIHTGVEDLFIKEIHPAAKTVVAGRPSVPTMINFLLVSLAGILVILGYKKTHPAFKIIGLVVGLIGALALIGYVISFPIFYYYIPGLNSAMACNTAGLFVLLGVGLLCL
jgi:hypothetical protein